MQHNVLHVLPKILAQDTILELDCMGLFNPLIYVD
jgi:hypothetical protein